MGDRYADWGNGVGFCGFLAVGLGCRRGRSSGGLVQRAVGYNGGSGRDRRHLYGVINGHRGVRGVHLRGPRRPPKGPTSLTGC
jgi:hypothetical protein